MPLADWSDVERARRAADDAAEAARMRPLDDDENPDYAAAGVLVLGAEALRLEIRALGVTISYAVDEVLRGR